MTVTQTGHEFLFGCNIYGFDHAKTKAQNDAYKQRFAELFNYATVGFYWRWYETAAREAPLSRDRPGRLLVPRARHPHEGASAALGRRGRGSLLVDRASRNRRSSTSG